MAIPEGRSASLLDEQSLSISIGIGYERGTANEYVYIGALTGLDCLLLLGFLDFVGLAWKSYWCREGDSNPHSVTTGGF